MNRKLLISTTVIAIAFVVIVVFAANPSIFVVPNNSNQMINLTPTSNPTITNQPTQIPDANAKLTITYHSVELGCGRLCLDITIQNQGYNSFSTDPSKFYVTLDDTNYEYSATFTPQFGNWITKTLANGETYSGTLVFSNSKATAIEFTLNHRGDNINIEYLKK